MLTTGRADDLTELAVGVLREAEDFVGLVALVGVGVFGLVAAPTEGFPGVAVSAEGWCTLCISLAARSTDPVFCLLMMPMSEVTETSVLVDHTIGIMSTRQCKQIVSRHKNDLEGVYHCQALCMKRVAEMTIWKERVNATLRM